MATSVADTSLHPNMGVVERLDRENALGAYLKDRRAQLNPEAFGFSQKRRRTPGLRREEVAQRAKISSTWYTWLEQGRGGAPSAGVLNRIAEALMLTDTEREHLFVLGLGHPPEARYHQNQITPALQRVLNALDPNPALIRTATWDVVGWNRAFSVALIDYGTLPPNERNILRAIFLDPRVKAAQPNWLDVARFVVGSFRADVARAGATRQATALVDELCLASPEFSSMWCESNVQISREGQKILKHETLGQIAFEFSSFIVDGRSDLTMTVYSPLEASTAAKIAYLLALPSRSNSN